MTLLRRVALCLAASAAWAPTTAQAQAQRTGSAGRELQRAARIQELQRLEVDTRMRANPDVPVGERALIDYGGYFTFNYLSLDDSQHDNHVLRQYDLVGYARVQFDGANEFFLRARTGYRDFNDQDSFDGRGDEQIDPDLDRA